MRSLTKRLVWLNSAPLLHPSPFLSISPRCTLTFQGTSPLATCETYSTNLMFLRHRFGVQGKYQFRGSTYQFPDGLPMGDPLSSFVLETFLDKMERDILTSKAHNISNFSQDVYQWHSGYRRPPSQFSRDSESFTTRD